MTESNDMPPPPPPAPDPTAPATMPGNTTPMAYAGTGAIEMNKDARTWGMLAHLSALVQVLGIPSILGPLIVWLIKKNEHPFVDDQGKEAVNFNLTVLIAALVLTPTICLAGIGILLLIALGVAALILAIIAAMKANEGIAYRYPWTLRLIK
jgi:uncharacterized protein